MPPPDPILPRPPDDPERLRRLREEASRRLEQPAYPPPPAPVYGGAPIVRRRWALRGVLIALLAAVAGIVAWLVGRVIVPAPVYGGPPPRIPPEPKGSAPAAVYGGPPPRQP
jgi:hypothetical protein